MDPDDQIISANISLPKHLWENLLHHISNDAEFVRIGLAAQASEFAKRIYNESKIILAEIESKTGVKLNDS